VINEVCANAIRKLSFDEAQIRDLIASFYGSCSVIEQNRELLVKASHLRNRYRFSFWDSLIVASALQSNVSTLYSEDMQDGLGVNNQLEIINPFK
jgi:predicted nucleic acid-binding protein